MTFLLIAYEKRSSLAIPEDIQCYKSINKGVYRSDSVDIKGRLMQPILDYFLRFSTATWFVS